MVDTCRRQAVPASHGERSWLPAPRHVAVDPPDQRRILGALPLQRRRVERSNRSLWASGEEISARWPMETARRGWPLAATKGYPICSSLKRKTAPKGDNRWVGNEVEVGASSSFDASAADVLSCSSPRPDAVAPHWPEPSVHE
jgi:hypothetical protein